VDSDNANLVRYLGVNSGPPPLLPSPLTAGNAAGDLFVASFLNFWSLKLQRFGATPYAMDLSQAESVARLAASDAGEAFVTGVLGASSVDLGCGPIAGGGGFAMKVSPTGQCAWSRPLPPDDQGLDRFMIGGAHDYFVGTAPGAFDLGCGPLTSAGAFLAAYDPAGACLWDKAVAVNDLSQSFLLPGGDPILVGAFTGTVDVGCGSVISASGVSTLVARLDKNGACVWSKSFNTTGLSVAPSPAGDIIISGSISSSLNLGGGLLTPSGVSDLAVARWDGTTGAHAWSEHFGGVGASITGTLAVDGTGGMLAQGAISGGTVDFGGGPLTSTSYLLRLDSAGTFRWQSAVPSDAQATADPCGGAIVATVCEDCGASFYACPGMVNNSALITVQRIAP
jgi:hypothetical protein